MRSSATENLGPANTPLWWRVLAATFWLSIPPVVMFFAGRALFAPGVPSLSDHPDRLALMIHARQFIESGLDPYGWIPTWMGGSAEMQFYPSGFALLGAVIGIITRVPTEEAYRVLVFITYLLPAVTVPLMLRSFSVRPAVAALAGLVASYLAFGQSGTVVGVGYGVIGSRLSLSVAPILVLAFKKLIETERARWSIGLAVSTAFLILLHPYHFPTALVVAFTATDVWRRNQPEISEGRRRALLALAAGVFLSGVWWSGLVLLRNYTEPFAWGNLRWIDFIRPAHSPGPDWWAIVIGALITTALTVTRGDDQRFKIARPLPPLLLLIGVIYVVDYLGFEYLDPFRLMDDLYFWTAVSSVLWLEALPSTRRFAPAVAALALGAGALWVGAERSRLDPGVTYSFRLEELERGVPGQLWNDLNGRPGRVLFTSSIYPTGSHVFSLTGVKIGREFIGGSSGGASPMGSFILYGPSGGPIRDLISRLDDKQMFGLRWTDVARSPDAAKTLWSYCVDLGITAIVTQMGPPTAPEEALADYPDLFRRRVVVGDLEVYEVLGVVPGKIVAVDGKPNISVAEVSDRLTRAAILGDDDSVVLIRLLHSPYWTVRVDRKEVETTQDRFRQIIIRVPRGPHVIEAEYDLPTSVSIARWICVILGVGLMVLSLPSQRRIKFVRDQTQNPAPLSDPAV